MKRPLFSVIVPCFNRESTIREALESICNQDFCDFETIVVDDASTDNSVSIVEEFNWVQIVRQQNGGPGAARNAGALSANGRYLAFLDSDDVWFPWTLSTIADVISSENAPSIIGGAAVQFATIDDLLQYSRGGTPDLDRRQTFLSKQRSCDCFVGAGMLVVSKSVFDSAGGFETKLANCEDHEFMLRIGDSPGFVKVEKPFTIGWRRHDGNTTNVLERNLSGLRFIIDREKANQFPGGNNSAIDRRAFICARTRPVIIECIAQNRISDSWSLFLSVLPWQARLLRIKFIGAYFVIVLKNLVLKLLGI